MWLEKSAFSTCLIIVYNESVNENLKNVDKLLVFHRSEKQYDLKKTEMEVHETVLCHHIHQVGLFIFRLLA